MKACFSVPMPMGTTHDEAGWLNEQNGELLLRRDEGGAWRLDAGLIQTWKARRFVGARVRVQGVRVDFDTLALKRIEPF